MPKIRHSSPKQSIRDRANRGSGDKSNSRVRLSAGINKSKRLLAGRKREFHIPLPNNRLGRILRKRVRIFPKFLTNAWAEIRQVSWPSRRETMRLSMAVFVFSVIFGVFIAVIDYGLDRLFKEIILK